MFAVAEDRFEPRPGRVRLLKRIISNNSCAHDEQGDNSGQENRGLDGVLDSTSRHKSGQHVNSMISENLCSCLTRERNEIWPR